MSKEKKWIITLGLMFIVQMFLLFYFRYISAQQTQMFVSNRLYSTWNAVLSSEYINLEYIYSKLPNNSRMFFEHNETGSIRTFYQNDNWMPPMTDGVFFDLDDLETAQAVVGIHILEDLEYAPYFTIEDYTYTVVGILGTDFPSPLDHLVLLNDIGNSLPVMRIVLDSDQPAVVDQLIENFDVITINENRALERFLDSNIFDQLIHINVTMIFIFLVIFISYSYFNFFKQRDYISFLLGELRFKLLANNLLALTFLFGFSLILTFLIDLVTNTQIIFKQVIPIYVIIGLSILFVHSGIFLLHRRTGGMTEND